MQQKTHFFKVLYFNNWLLSAKLLSLLIFVYTSLFLISCRQNAETPDFTAQNPPAANFSAININTAGVAELEKLPRIGSETALKIVEHREKYGAFRRAENLILVEGMSDKKFRGLRSLVKVE